MAAEHVRVGRGIFWETQTDMSAHNSATVTPERAAMTRMKKDTV